MPNNAGLNDVDHFSDEELLLFAEGEILQAKADQIRRHLVSCSHCRSRESVIESTVSEFVRLHRSQLGAKVSSGAGPRALLKARLDEMAHAEQRPWWRRFEEGISRRWIYAYVSLGIVGLFVPALYRQSRLSNSRTIAIYADVRPMPNSNLTPGDTRPVGLADICPQRESDLDPAVSPSVQKAVFQEYGIAEMPSKNYQVDYLINPQLGGTDDIRNLWPQPYGATVWNARAKDALESRLYQMVCERQLDLASAQRDIATDWISAYKKYFHTTQPV
jgi:hypothetical protein